MDSRPDHERILDEILLEITSELDISNLLETILRMGCELFHAEAGSIVFWESDLGVFTSTYNFRPELKLRGTILTKEEGISGQIYQRQDIVAIRNYSRSAYAYGPLKKEGYGLAFGVPIFTRDRLVGNINFYTTQADRKLSEQEKVHLLRLARQASVAILNAQLYQELENKTKKIEETKHFLDLLLDNAIEIIINTELNGKITYWNKTAETILGYSKSEIMGEKLPVWPSGKSSDRFNRLFLRVRRGDAFQDFRLLFKTKAGSKALLKLSMVPIRDHDEKIVSVLITGQDITEKRKLELQMTKSQEMLEEKDTQLHEALQGLEITQERLLQAEKLATIVELSGGIAHEINNPLNGIINYAQLVLDEINDLMEKEPAREIVGYLGGIMDESEKIEKVTHDLLTLSRFERYETYRPTRIEDVIESAVRILDIEFKRLNIQVDVTYAREADGIPHISGRYELLETCLANLLKNCVAGLKARKISQELPRTIRITAEVRTINLERHVVVTIEDNGVPISDDLLPRFFDPFSATIKDENPRKNQGLEMSIVLSVIKNHHGEIDVQQGKDKTRFVLIFPVDTL